MKISLNREKPLIVILGPTASGKTEIALKLAEKYRGEIICADSRTIYKYLNIGTAKPTMEQLQRVKHWGLDLVDPGERFTVADFKKYAVEKIDEIRKRGNIPILVGGSGLYIDSIVFDYSFGNDTNEALRQKLQLMSLEELQDYCKKDKIKLPENYKNKRYLIRSIEKSGMEGTKSSKPINNCIIVGITTEKTELRKNIKNRIECFFENGVIDEVKMIYDKYGWDNEAMKSNVYSVVMKYLKGDISLDDAKKATEILDNRLVKKQKTWFKRNEYINWLPLSQIEQFIDNQLVMFE
ncbi:MAG TPA: tRNA (adenosine(37)-N6)-dimethylallyltransferase MiaA [Candidatus Saccharibacteria bacterium]|nr:tRNA (adenosine(37)-N6)-dimethylallyltransferase MiaA [Candidatus Saccharibacteria bacterium]